MPTLQEAATFIDTFLQEYYINRTPQQVTDYLDPQGSFIGLWDSDDMSDTLSDKISHQLTIMPVCRFLSKINIAVRELCCPLFIACGSFSTEMVVDASPLPISFHLSAVFRKTEKQWQMLQLHLSPTAPTKKELPSLPCGESAPKLIEEVYVQTQRKNWQLLSHNRRLKEENHHLQVLSNTDPLTKLWNQRSIQNHLKRQIHRVEQGGSLPFSILFFDVDNFKHINDTAGHSAGDAVLQQIAHIAKVLVRSEDIVCRYGGDEFLVILESTKLSDAKIIAQRLYHQVRLHHFPQYGHPVTISIGIAAYRYGCSAKSLLEEADQKMYFTKKTRKLE